MTDSPTATQEGKTGEGHRAALARVLGKMPRADFEIILAEVQAAEARAHATALERAAKVAEHYSINEPELYPGVPWAETNDSAKAGCHIAAQEIANAIRSLSLSTGNEGGKDNG